MPEERDIVIPNYFTEVMIHVDFLFLSEGMAYQF